MRQGWPGNSSQVEVKKYFYICITTKQQLDLDIIVIYITDFIFLQPFIYIFFAHVVIILYKYEQNIAVMRLQVFSHKKNNGMKQSQFTPKGLIGYSNVVQHWNPVNL